MNHEYVKVVDVELLHAELKLDAGITTEITGVSYDSGGTKCFIHFNGTPSASELTASDAVIVAHNAIANSATKSVEKAVSKAMGFGKNLMIEYAAVNVLSGKTTAEVKTISDKLVDLQRLLDSGSLYVALEEMDNVVPDTLVTQATIDDFKAKISTYLGV